MQESITFTDEGTTWVVLASRGETRTVRAWSSYHKIRSTSEFFLLFSTRKNYTLIPKRIFNPEALTLFSRFVEYGFTDARGAQPAAPPLRSSAPAAEQVQSK